MTRTWKLRTWENFAPMLECVETQTYLDFTRAGELCIECERDTTYITVPRDKLMKLIEAHEQYVRRPV